MKHDKSTRTSAFGGVIVKDDKFLLREPSNHFSETVWTFAKGRPHHDETPEQTALREVREETGYQCKIIAEIPGLFAGIETDTTYFLMTPVAEPTAWSDETQAIVWVTAEEAPARLSQSNRSTAKRDLAVLAAAIKVRDALNAATDSKAGTARRNVTHDVVRTREATNGDRETAVIARSKIAEEVAPATAPDSSNTEPLVGLSRTELTRALAIAQEAARAAGAVLAGQFYLAKGPDGAHGHAPADELAEALIRTRLTSSFPAWTWYAEEGGGVHPNARETGWIVDPNDGTSAYLSGHRGSAVSIALVHHGEPVLGVVFAYAAPDADGDMIAGAKGLGITRNGVRLSRQPLPTNLMSDHVVLLNRKPSAKAG